MRYYWWQNRIIWQGKKIIFINISINTEQNNFKFIEKRENSQVRYQRKDA